MRAKVHVRVRSVGAVCSYNPTILVLFADDRAVATIACGEFGWSNDLNGTWSGMSDEGEPVFYSYTYVPAISLAMLPKAVVVVVAVCLTPLRAFLKNLVGLIDIDPPREDGGL